MEESLRPHDKIRAALFVDFDNIYSGLKNVHPKAAEEFATNPARWLAWFEQGMPPRGTGDAARVGRRTLLLRHCYLNPTAFSRYRAHFTRAAFRVVDCPPLTQQNKNSTDIHMVMDILDALRHDTRFDEFILLSGDSDFTPVLLRLRLHDRQTVVLTPGPAAQAYKAASDHVVSEDLFIEEALGIRLEQATRAVAAQPSVAAPAGQEPAPAAPPPPPPAGARDGAGTLGEKILARVNELVAASPSPVTMATASMDVIKNVGREVLTSKWAGAGTFKKLMQSAASGSFAVAISSDAPGYLYDPARHSPPAAPKKRK